MSYKSDKLDALIDEARSTIDEETRMPIWHEAHRIMHEDQPYTFLFFPKTLAFMDKRFEHVRVTNLGLNPRVEWYVPQDRQRWTKD
jgi:peptide/nickel transport system substrate-binding protein